MTRGQVRRIGRREVNILAHGGGGLVLVMAEVKEGEYRCPMRLIKGACVRTTFRDGPRRL